MIGELEQRPVCRREFLRRTARQLAIAGAVSLGGCLRAQPEGGGPSAAAPTVSPTAARATGRARVVRVTHPDAFRGDTVCTDAVEQMVDAGMRRLLGTATAAEAFRRPFQPGDVVGLKVNCLAGPLLSTHPEVTYCVARGIVAVGIPSRNVIVYDRESSELASAGYDVTVRPADVRCIGSDMAGYDSTPTVQGTVGTCFSRIVSERVSALVNLPVLKDHDLAGLSGALKNHYGSIHNPNKLHMNHCSPYVADLNCAPVLRGKQRLVVCDALLCCYDGGPSHKPETTEVRNSLLFSEDAVAVDWLCARMIDELRAARQLPSLKEEGREPRFIAEAAAPSRGIGVAGESAVEVVDVPLG